MRYESRNNWLVFSESVPSILSGEEISRFIKQVESAESGEKKQPAGFDVTLSRVYSYSNSEYTLDIGKTENSSLHEISSDEGYFCLKKGAYLADLNEVTSIPSDSIGLLLPRSTLLRNGLDVRTALFDPGYSGQPKVMLVCHRPARIRRFSRIGQLVLLRSDSGFGNTYTGRYQDEGSSKK